MILLKSNNYLLISNIQLDQLVVNRSIIQKVYTSFNFYLSLASYKLLFNLGIINLNETW